MWSAASVGVLSATASRGGLTIVPTWASSITSDPNAAAIETSINSAIAVYAAKFTDNVTATITFEEIGSGLGQSSWYYYGVSYGAYYSALQFHKTSGADTTALAHLSSGPNNPVNGSPTMFLQGPVARALGFNTPPPAGDTDATVSLNTSIMNLSAPYTQNSSRYSIYSTVSHEIDECLGIGSALNGLANGAAAPTDGVFSMDLFRYDSVGNRSFNTTASTASYFSIDGTTDLVRYNQQQGGDFSDWYSYFGGVTPQVQNAYASSGTSPVLGIPELTALDVIGFTPAVTSPVTLKWDPGAAAGVQDGAGTWNTTTANFSDGTTNYAWTNGTSLNAVFGASNGAAGVVTLGASITAQTITFNAASSGNYNIAGGGFTLSLTSGATITSNVNATISAPLSITGGLLKNGVGNLTLSGNTTATGIATIGAGTVSLTGGTFTATSAVVQSGAALNWSTGTLAATTPVSVTGVFNLLPNTGAGFLTRSVNTVTINSGGQVNVLSASNHANRQFVVAAGLSIAGSTNAWQGQIDLANNDLDVQGGSLSTITNQIKAAFAAGAWTGNGIASSTAKADASHLTTLGVILNGNAYGIGGSLGTFDGQNPATADVLVKYTWFGDANLDGKVDGGDYSKIDFGLIANGSLTGWQNGDFNYDGAVDGSDYTLIDNAYNHQTVNLNTAALTAATAAGVAAVPEPASIAAVIAFGVALSSPRRRFKV